MDHKENQNKSFRQPLQCCLCGATDSVSLHAFPKDSNEKKIWTASIQRDLPQFAARTRDKICSRHFKPQDILGGDRKHVRRGAAPTFPVESNDFQLWNRSKGVAQFVDVKQVNVVMDVALKTEDDVDMSAQNDPLIQFASGAESGFQAITKPASGKRWSYQGDFKREDMVDEQLALKYFDITKEYIDKLKLAIKKLQNRLNLSSEKCHKRVKPLEIKRLHHRAQRARNEIKKKSIRSKRLKPTHNMGHY